MRRNFSAPPVTCKWTEESTEQLLEVVASVRMEENMNWNIVGESMGRSAQECKAWFTFLISVSAKIPAKERSPANLRKRKRRKASQITRAFPCTVVDCKKSYGTEGALKFHIQNKHKDCKYIPSYLHPYNASNSKWENEGMPQQDNPVLLGPPIMFTPPADGIPMHQFAPYPSFMRGSSLIALNSQGRPEVFNSEYSPPQFPRETKFSFNTDQLNIHPHDPVFH